MGRFAVFTAAAVVIAITLIVIINVTIIDTITTAMVAASIVAVPITRRGRRWPRPHAFASG